MGSAVMLLLIFLVLCAIIVFVIFALDGIKPKKTLSEFESMMVENSEKISTCFSNCNKMRSAECLIYYLDADEQSESLFRTTIMTNENVHITRYLWHYGYMLYNIDKYRNKVSRQNFSNEDKEMLFKAIDEYEAALMETVVIVFNQSEIKKIAAFCIDALDEYMYEFNVPTVTSNKIALSGRCSISLMRKIATDRIIDITKEEILYGTVSFGKFNFLSAFDPETIVQVSHDESIVLAYALYEEELEVLFCDSDFAGYGYIRMGIKSGENITRTSTDKKEFMQFLAKNAKSPVIKEGFIKN